MRINAKIGIVVFLIFFILYLLLYYYSINISHNKGFSTIIVTLNIIVIILFMSLNEKYFQLRKQYIRINPIFIIAYFIVFFQLHLDYTLDNFDETHSRFWVNLAIVPKALMISSLGFISYVLGYTFKHIRGNRNLNKNEYYKSYPISGYNFLSLFLLLGFVLFVNPLYLFGGYGIYEMGSEAGYLSILFELSITASVVQHLINLKNDGIVNLNIIQYLKSLGYFKIILLIIYFSMILMSGDRGPIIYLTLGIYSSFFILTKSQISLIKFGLLVFIGSTLVSTLVVLRNSIDDKKTIIEKLQEGFKTKEHKSYESIRYVNSISNSTLELATSIRTLHNGVNEVPENRDYFYGQFQFLQIITIVPLGQQMISSLFEIEEAHLTTAKYVSNIVGAKTGSEGTSCIVDLYLDFGVYGVILIMFLFGFYIRYIEVEVMCKRFPKKILIIAFILFTQYAIYIPRATILFNVRNVFWVLFIIFLINLFSKPKVKSVSNENSY